jgi:Concanavalin A-like lectin/glucanases superfamily
MPHRSWFLIAITAFAALASAGYAQTPIGGEGLYCTAGLVPDGYIDFSSLPPGAPIKNGVPSAPVTATLPVVGIPGLTVKVTIPSLINSPATTSGPIYSVDGGTLSLNGLSSQSESSQTPTLLTLTFNQAIAGLGLNASTDGRFTYSYTLTSGVPEAGNPIIPFATTANGFNQSPGSPQTQHLEMVGLQTTFTTATVQFSGGEFSSLALSNLRVRSASAPDLSIGIPKNGLQQWLRADTNSVFTPTTLWRDQSGNGHNATPWGGPGLGYDGKNCQLAFGFAANQYFSFNLPIAGWHEMTVFLVAKANNDGPPGASDALDAAIFWVEDAFWGNTYISPFQTHAFARFGTTQVGNNLFIARPGGSIGQDFTVTRAVHNDNTDSLYVNGVLATSQGGKYGALSGVTGAATIGQGLSNSGFNGEVAEILVYNRVLTDSEAATVESYLALKYGTQ